MNWRSLGFRLSCFFSALLLAGLALLGASLWWGVEHNMTAAIDELLEARATGFAHYAQSEFGNVFVESRTDSNKGEYRGLIEQVDRDGHWVSLQGTRIRLTDRTKFEGSLVLSRLRTGKFGEVEVERAGAGSNWEAATVAVVTDLAKEIKETFAEYAQTAPDGLLIQLRNQAGERILPVRAESAPLVAWQETVTGFTTVATSSGPYRSLRRDVSLPSGTYHLQMASSLAPVWATKAALLRLARWILPLLLLMSLSGGYLVSRAALLPLEDFSAVAKRISAYRLSDRLEVRRTGDVIERLAITFNSMLDRLASSVKRLDEFTADASHELRGPAAVIRTTAELALRQDRTGENLQRDIREIHAEAVRLSELIEDLLTLARLEGSIDQSLLSAVDLGPMAEEVAKQFGGQAGARITANTGEGTSVVRGHEASLRRLLLILVDNALRHNPEDTVVRISAARADAHVVLAVADSGRGVPAADLSRLFDRFYRVDPARNRANGAGLGLAIARRIVEGHGGQISASSEVGVGSVFRVSLEPYLVESEVVEPASPTARASAQCPPSR